MQWLLKHRLAETAALTSLASPDVAGIRNQSTAEKKSSLKLGITLLLKVSVAADRMVRRCNQNDLLNLIVVICEQFAFVSGGL